MSSTNEDGTTLGTPPEEGVDTVVTGRPKGRPGRKPKGSVPTIVADLPDKPDPDHVLTWRQRKVLQVIRDSVQRRGYPPSMREIGEAVGLTSTSSVSYQLSTLQSKGYLRRDAGRPRTVEVRLPGHPAVRPEAEEPVPALDIASQDAAYVPLIGRIAAGGPDTQPLRKHLQPVAEEIKEHRRQCSHVQRDIEGQALIRPSQQLRNHHQMGRAADGKKLGEALDNAQNDHLKKRHKLQVNGSR